MDSAVTSSDLPLQAFHVLLQKRVGLASLALLFWDHVLTFSDEINYIWRQRQSPITVLFLILRYFTLFTLLFEICSYLFQGWTPESCDIILKLRVPPATFVIIIFLVHMIMILRVYALYRLDLVVLVSLLALLGVEIMIMGVALSFMIENARPFDTEECLIFPGDSRNFTISGLYWSAPLLDDTVIFLMTLRKSRQYARSRSGIPLVKTFVQDGVTYYIIMCFTHLLNLIFFVTGAGDVKPVASSLSHSLTTLLVCRLILNLRKQDQCRPQGNHRNHTRRVMSGEIEPPTTGVTAQLSSLVSLHPFIGLGLDASPSSREDLAADSGSSVMATHTDTQTSPAAS